MSELRKDPVTGHTGFYVHPAASEEAAEVYRDVRRLSYLPGPALDGRAYLATPGFAVVR